MRTRSLQARWWTWIPTCVVGLTGWIGSVPSGASASIDTYAHTAEVSTWHPGAMAHVRSGLAEQSGCRNHQAQRDLREAPRQRRANLAGVMVEGLVNKHELETTMGRGGHVHGAYISRNYCLC